MSTFSDHSNVENVVIHRNSQFASSAYCFFCFHEYVEKVRRPKILPCQHDICEQCVSKLFEEANKKFICCPNCQIEHMKLTPFSNRITTGVIPKKNLLKVSATAISYGSVQCERRDCVRNAYKKCFHCNKWYCSAHYMQEKKEIAFEMQSMLRQGKSRKNDLQKLVKNINEQSKVGHGHIESAKESIDQLILRLESVKQDLEVLDSDLSEQIEKDSSTINNSLQELDKMLLGIEKVVNNQEKSSISATDLWEKNVALQKYLDDTKAFVLEFPVTRVVTIEADWKLLHNNMLHYLSKITCSLKSSKAMEESIKKDSLHSQLTSRAVHSLLSKASLSIVEVNGRPLDIAVCHNTSGYCIQGGRVVTSSDNRKSLCVPAFFLKLWNEESHLLLLNSDGQQQARVFLNLHMLDAGSPHIWNVICWEEQQRLILSDISSKNGGIHVCDLAGRTVRRTVEGLVRNPRGMCVIKSSNLLVVCDICETTASQSGRLVILGLPELQHYKTILHSTLQDPVYPSIVSQLNNDYILVTNNSSGTISAFRLPDFAFCNEQLTFRNPWRLLTYENSRMFVSDWHGVTEVAVTEIGESNGGQMISLARLHSVGSVNGCQSHQFSYPRGLVHYSICRSGMNEQKLVVCDLMNHRLKMFTLRII